jgi:uncharacterized Zn-binding protein involved in type VI secretion
MFATTNSPDGKTTGVTVNKTQVGPAQVPIPYPSIGQLQQFDPGTLFAKVLIQGFQAAVMMSKTTATMGDEAGSVGGVMSGKASGPAQVISGSSKVMMGGKPAATQASSYTSNGSPVFNTVAVQDTASCTNVQFAS